MFATHWRYGFQSRCRDCKRVDAAEAYKRDPEKFRARTRARPPEGKRAASARWRTANPERVKLAMNQWRANRPAADKRRAYLLEKAKTRCACNAVSNAVRAGRLAAMPCEVCGSAEAQGHHDDYRERYSVRWLCRQHHEDWHAANKPVYLPDWEAHYASMLEAEGLTLEQSGTSSHQT